MAAAKKTTLDGKCCKQVYGGSYHGHPCGKSAKVTRDGKLYCGTHDPVARQEKQSKRSAEWNAEFNERQRLRDAAQKRNAAIDKLCGHIPTEELEQYELRIKA